MMLIPCPWCGPRDESEFVCGGERVQPRSEAVALGDDAWLERMMIRANRRGAHVETWWHAKGCLVWFAITRDTLTHEIADKPERAP